MHCLLAVSLTYTCLRLAFIVVTSLSHSCKGKRPKITTDLHKGSKFNRQRWRDCCVLLWDSERNLPVIAALDGSPLL